MVAESLGKLSDKFIVEQVQTSYSVGQNNFKNGSINASKTGYKLLGPIGWQITGNASTLAVVFRLYSAATTIYYYVKNTSTSGGTITQTITVDCLYVKE